MTDLSAYAGRTIDVLAFRGATPNGEVLLAESLADASSSGEICTGIQKLAQRFLLEMLTEVGTIAYAPLRGTELLTSLLSGKARSTLDVQAIFALAELQARVNLAGEESEDDPADERYSQTTLLSVTLSPGKVVLRTQLESQAGESVEVILPISIVL